MYVYTCNNAYIYIYIHTREYPHTYIHTYIHIYMCVCANVNVYGDGHGYVHGHVYVCVYVCVYIHTYIHIYMYVYISQILRLSHWPSEIQDSHSLRRRLYLMVMGVRLWIASENLNCSLDQWAYGL